MAEKDVLPDSGVAVAHGGEPVPADGGEECGAVDGAFAAVVSEAIAQRMFVRSAGMRLRRDQHGDDGFCSGLYLRSDVEDAADECAANDADLRTVDPDGGGIVDAFKVEPDVMMRVGSGDGEDGAIPPGGARKALWNHFRTVVFAIERLRIEMVVDQGCKHCAGDGGREPTSRIESGCGDLRAGLRDF